MPIPAPAPAPPTEDILLALSRFDTVLLVDDSKSMRGSRWTQAGKALSTLATIAARYDEDGIDIEFLNSKRRGSGMKDEAAVNALFTSVTPRGWTPLGTRLDAILSAYQCKLKENPEETKPLNLIVITDGAPSTFLLPLHSHVGCLPLIPITNAADDPATEDAILRSARALDVWNARITQLGIQFVQIGNDARARAYLEALDDGLSVHGVRVRDVYIHFLVSWMRLLTLDGACVGHGGHNAFGSGRWVGPGFGQDLDWCGQ
ncbi:hypothetical protein H0H81_008076 [Sphagnurus paluster]|uniref:VWFA domain-containing protein n=1 Tax=Sphagnurus paluster TaxID=117069 RepID=A0A9P7K4T1_9AGAR|nr:hypothetical protein H0H81_008076 [Sphagnurus paluster]